MAYASSAEILIWWRNNNKHFSSEVVQTKVIKVKDAEKKIGNAAMKEVLELLSGDEKKAFEAQSKGFSFGKFGGRKTNTNWKEDRTVPFQKTGSVVLSSLPAFFGVKKEDFEKTSLLVHFDEKNKTVVVSLVE